MKLLLSLFNCVYSRMRLFVFAMNSRHKRTGTFGLGGAVTFLPEKCTQLPNAWLLKLGYRRTQTARKTNSFTIYLGAGNFLWELNFAGLDSGKKSRIWISYFTRGNNFSQISYTLFESNKNGSHMVVFVTVFATNFIEVQQCKNGVNFCCIFVGGSLFSRDLIIANQWKSSKFSTIRSHINFIPHSFSKIVFFFKHCILNQLIIL